ncbi:glycosyltransferase, partial [Candidatus Methylomirabilis sp.]|uniref:glycosyltransferase n=1 Tax=Candidatus Methylomirabilis sp. TaxID=2032687 RepID=UPI003C75F0B8
MRICRIALAPITKIFERFPQRDYHLLPRLSRLGHEIHEVSIAPAWRPAIPSVAYLVALLKATPRLASIKADLILADALEAAVIGWMSARVKRIPFVFDYRDHYSFLYRKGSGWRNLRTTQILERWLPRVADLVITVDGRCTSSCIEAGVRVDRIRMVPNGADPQLFTPGPRDQQLLAQWGLSGRQVILYVGKTTHSFNLPMVLEAMREVVQHHPQACFLIVGDGAALPELERLCLELELTRHVVLTGYHPYSEIPTLIRLSNVCVYPLRSVAALSMFEYMACGKPVVVPNADYDLSLPEGSCLPVQK